MKRTSKISFSTTIVLAIMLLACLLLHSMGTIGAWFTATDDKIQIQLNVSGMGAYVYQTIDSTDYRIVADLDKETDKKYIELSGIIEPDTIIPLTLKFGTTEPAGLYVRFKFELYALGESNPITTTLSGLVEDGKTNGFVLHSNGWYNYLNTSSSTLQKFTPTTSNGVTEETKVTMFTGFEISLDNFASLNGETIKIVVTVEAQDTEFSN